MVTGFFGRLGSLAAAGLAAGALMVASAAYAEDVSPEWQKVIDAAKAEGTVTLYTSAGLPQANALAEKFTEKYGISVEVVQAIDADLFPKIAVEFETGRGIADVVSNSSVLPIAENEAKGVFAPVIGPAFDNPAYNRAQNVPRGVSFLTNAYIMAYCWNTELVPDGLKGYDDMFREDLVGLVGIPRPSVSTLVDLYFYLMENYGDDYVDRLVDMKPRIYPSAFTLAQALSSGEIAATPYCVPLIDEKAAGAPVDFAFAPVLYGIRNYGNVLTVAPHPNAAQLLANFIVTEEGQVAIARKTASVLPDVPGTVGRLEDVRKPNLEKLTPQAVEEFQAKFTELFGAN